jgi:hypothetical protein
MPPGWPGSRQPIRNHAGLAGPLSSARSRLRLVAAGGRRTPFTKLLLRPVALFASRDWEIGRNRAKFMVSRACCRPLGGALHGRQEELT